MAVTGSFCIPAIGRGRRSAVSMVDYSDHCCSYCTGDSDYQKKGFHQLLSNGKGADMSYSIKTRASIFLKDYQASRKICRVNKKPHAGTIRVAFIVQMAEIWDKEEPVYEAMLSNDLFEPTLIVIPPYDQVQENVPTSYEDNFFLKKYPEAVKGFDNGRWMDIKTQEYDYVFLQRPYDHYLPQGFRGSDIVDFAKVCYRPYGVSSADGFNGGNTDKLFFRNVYMSFMESDYMAKLLQNQFRFPFEKDTHHVLSLGYPALLPYLSFPDIHQVNRVLWTPRWSFDPVTGGSNFLVYKETFVELAAQNPHCQFVFRPHPLMFGEIVRQGIMMQTEIDDYLNTLHENKVIYDYGTPLLETLLDTDLLITDFSSIIIQFFLTKRPIIYCPSCIELNETIEQLKEGMYLANTSEELIRVTNDLVDQKDSLKEKRLSIINNKEFEAHRDAVNNILSVMKQDFGM